MLDFLALYKESFSSALGSIYTTFGFVEVFIFSVFALLYFFMESFSGLSLGRLIAHKKVIFVRDITKKEKIERALLRSAVKIVPLVPIVLLFSIAKNQKFSQTLVDRTLGFSVISTVGEPGKVNFRERLIPMFISSIFIYYLTFIGSIIILFHFSPPVSLSNPGNSGSSSLSFLQSFYSIFSNNINLDIRYIISGLGAGIELISNVASSNILEGAFLVVIIKGLGWNSIVQGVLPQFFPETLGYCMGIVSSFSITFMEMDSLEALIRGTKITEYYSSIKIDSMIAITALVASIILIIIGALIEASL